MPAIDRPLSADCRYNAGSGSGNSWVHLPKDYTKVPKDHEFWNKHDEFCI